MLASKLALTVLLVALGCARASPAQSKVAESRDYERGVIKLITLNAVEGAESPFKVYAILKKSYKVVKVSSAEPGERAERDLQLDKIWLLAFAYARQYLEVVFAEFVALLSRVDDRPNVLEMVLRRYDNGELASFARFVYNRLPYKKEEGRHEEECDK